MISSEFILNVRLKLEEPFGVMEFHRRKMVYHPANGEPAKKEK
jgi:hypothetical protein